MELVTFRYGNGDVTSTPHPSAADLLLVVCDDQPTSRDVCVVSALLSTTAVGRARCVLPAAHAYLGYQPVTHTHSTQTDRAYMYGHPLQISSGHTHGIVSRTHSRTHGATLPSVTWQ